MHIALPMIPNLEPARELMRGQIEFKSLFVLWIQDKGQQNMCVFPAMRSASLAAFMIERTVNGAQPEKTCTR